MRQISALASLLAPLLLAYAAAAELLAYEVANAEGTTGRMRWLAQRLSKENVLYQLRLGDTHKSDLTATAAEVDRAVEMLSEGSPTFGVPAPWTPEIRDQVRRIDQVWGPLRAIATASPYEYLRQSRQFMEPESRLGDPLSIRYFDNLSSDLVAELDKLMALYHEECRKAGYPLCDMAAVSGNSQMILESATATAILVFAGLDVDKNRKKLKETMAAFQRQRAANDASDLFKAAVAPEAGKSGEITAQLLREIGTDWDAMRAEFQILLSGKSPDFDLHLVLKRQRRIVQDIERLRIVVGRFVDRHYGA